MDMNLFRDGTAVFYDDCGYEVGAIRDCSRELAEKVMDLVSEYMDRQEREFARWSNLNVHCKWPGKKLTVYVGDRVRQLEAKLDVDSETKKQIVEFLFEICSAVMDEIGAEGKLISSYDLD